MRGAGPSSAFRVKSGFVRLAGGEVGVSAKCPARANSLTPLTPASELQ